MPQLRVALAQVDMTVGDIDGNAEIVLRESTRAREAGAHVVVFPEMTLTGYPPEDLVFRESFAEASEQALGALATTLAEHQLAGLAVVVGYLTHDHGPRNACALLYDGRITATYYKHHLPNYGVFDEARYFVPGTRFPVVTLHGVGIGMTICEDMWQDGGPFAVAAAAGCDVVLCINGSPYERSKDDTRLPLARRRAREAGAVLAYVNTVGAQDELVFDGDSMVVDADGTLLARAPQFVEHLLITDLDLPDRSPAGEPDDRELTVERVLISSEPVPAYPSQPRTLVDPLPDEQEVWNALVLGLRDYVEKNGFRSVILGVSGGIDSAIVAAIAVDALGAERVHTVSMPSGYSSEHSRSDAADLAQRLGCHFDTVPIAPMVEAFLAATPLTGLAEENLQARVRGMLLMGLSNEHGHLVLATGNKTELAVGYSTIYGDAVGGIAPIKDVPKTLVWQLSRWRNAYAARHGQTPPIPENSISKPPSAELRPGQKDSDSLPPYAELDAILVDYVDLDRGYDELMSEGHDPETVAKILQLVDRAEYKRRQFPPGPKISPKAFGRDRRLPITSRWREVPPADA
ncbi:MAG: NAD+ synthase [Geodermatophilaceae bacterium]|nr:NAD+ synthase [Geodermatophilaceae bacterium]